MAVWHLGGYDTGVYGTVLNGCLAVWHLGGLYCTVLGGLYGCMALSWLYGGQSHSLSSGALKLNYSHHPDSKRAGSCSIVHVVQPIELQYGLLQNIVRQ